MAKIKVHSPEHLAKLREALRYYPETGILEWAYSARSRVEGKRAGHLSKGGYDTLFFDGTKHLNHRVAWFMYHGEYPTKFLDHINGRKHDNRISNLRLATVVENAANKPGFYGMKGTTRSACGRKWIARLKGRHLGTFATEQEAANAYDVAAVAEYGEYALTNALIATRNATKAW